MASSLFRSVSKKDVFCKLLLASINRSQNNSFHSTSFSELSKIVDRIPDVCFSARFLNKENRTPMSDTQLGSFEICTLKYDTVKRELNANARPFGNTDKVVCTSMKRLFEKAIYNIQNSIISNEYEQALFKLRNFLNNQDFHEECFLRGIHHEFERVNGELDRPIFPVPDSSIAVLLVVHLLSQLTVTGSQTDTCYVVADSYKNEHDACPCNMCGTEIVYSSAGSEYMISESPHICLLPNKKESMVNVVYTGDNSKNLQNGKKFRRDRMISTDSKSKKIGSSLSQIAAETITLSFYYMKDSEDQARRSFLIPSVAINEKGFDICMYDSVNDIFIKNLGLPIPLFDYTGHYFKRSSIINLWMVLNHSIFRPQFYQSDTRKLKGTFGLYTRYVDDDIYERVRKTVRKKLKNTDDHDFDEADRNDYDVVFLDDPELN